jgi:radical SAM protein with 4Fe4S-binding SPASM domain
MSFDLFERIAGELSPYLCATNLWGFGEPLLHPRLPEMVSFLESRCIPAEVSTNGMRLARDGCIEGLLDSGLSRLRVSLDGATQDVYKRYRKGGSLREIVGAIERIQRLKAQRHASKPWLAIQFIVMRQNEHEIAGMKRLARDLGVDLRLKAVAVCEERRAEYLPVESEIIRYGRDDDAERRSALCRFPWDTLTVNWDGSVVPCCKDPRRCHLIGRIDEHTSALEIWNGEALVRFRERLVKERHALPECSTCALPVKEKIPLAKNKNA